MRIIAFYDDGWFDTTTDFRSWDHLCRAFDVEFQLIREWEEAEPTGSVYLLDENGRTNIVDHELDTEGTYVVGRTHLELLSLDIPHADSIRIVTAQPISLFGVEAAAILLAKWL